MHSLISIQLIKDIYLLQEGRNIFNAGILEQDSQRTTVKIFLSHISQIHGVQENVLQHVS